METVVMNLRGCIRVDAVGEEGEICIPDVWPCVQVFEEVRNLCLGLAARSMPWTTLGRANAIAVWVILTNKVLSNLFSRSASIAESLQARGVVDPDTHHLNVPVLLPSNAFANILTGLTLVGCIVLALVHNPAFTVA
jgi:hypothetical protein